MKCLAVATCLVAAGGVAHAATVDVAVYKDFTDTGSGVSVSGAPAATGSFGVTSQEFVYNWTTGGTVGGYNQNDAFAAIFTGAISTATAGAYDFGLDTDDAGYLFIDGKLAISLGGAHGQEWGSTTLNLAAGTHSFRIEYDNVYCCDATTVLAIHQGAAFAASAPEPATWAMFGLGFVGVGLLGYRRTRRERLVEAL